MERRGILTIARDTIIPALVGGWRQKSDSVLGFIPPQRYGAEHGVIRPGNYESYIRANKGHVENCTRIRGEGVAEVDRKLYITKSKHSTKFPHTRTKELDDKTREYVWRRAKKYIQDAVDVVEVFDHPAIDLLRTVNLAPSTSEADLKHKSSGWLDITGECYWYTPFNDLKIPSEIWIIHSQHIKPHAGADRRIDSYIYKKGNTEIVYDKDEIVYFKLPSYTSYYNGRGIIIGAADMIDLRNYMLDYNKATFKNMGEIGGVIAYKDSPPKAILERRKKEFITEKMGVENVGSWTFVPGGEGGVDIHPFNRSPKDMGYEEGFAITQEGICAAYGIPPGMLTKRGTGSYAERKEDERYFAKHSVLPRVTLMDAILNEQLLPLYEKSNERLFLLSENPVPEDREIAMEERKVNIDTGVHTINEERAADNLEPLPGFDVPWLQMNYMPAGEERNDNDDELSERIYRAYMKTKERIRATA